MMIGLSLPAAPIVCAITARFTKDGAAAKVASAHPKPETSSSLKLRRAKDEPKDLCGLEIFLRHRHLGSGIETKAALETLRIADSFLTLACTLSRGQSVH